MRAGALSGCVRLDHAPPHHTTHHAHQGSSFWSILDAFCFSSLSSRESGIYGGEGWRLRILDSQRLPFGASWTLPASCFPLLARIGNLWRRGQAVQNSRFSGIASSRSFWTLLPARIENPWIGTRAYTRLFPVRRGVSLLNQGFGVELIDAIALIIN